MESAPDKESWKHVTDPNQNLVTYNRRTYG